ncbi:MAG TPA: FAD-dependent monooxygenase, partial [Rhodocyclaceae bacterium]|nr:FAD-dependent monooxygenase [Rhodocyclaceae bacterium]
MLRLTQIKTPLDHTPDDLEAAILKRLGIAASELLSYTIFRRGYDARKRSAIQFVFTLDVQLKDEAGVLRRLKAGKDGANIGPTPDTRYRFVAEAPAGLATRPVIIGTGPCGLLAGLLLAQMGFRPIILERGKAVRERTKDTWGLWREGVLNPESNVQFGEGGAGRARDAAGDHRHRPLRPAGRPAAGADGVPA